jgi:hypothetical protein
MSEFTFMGLSKRKTPFYSMSKRRDLAQSLLTCCSNLKWEV